MSKEYLPGQPPPRLIKAVRRTLRTYGIRPLPKLWHMTWAWANKIANSYVYRKTWPIPNEIVAQYTILLLADMRDHYALKLPYRSREQITPEVSVALSAAVPFVLPPHDPSA